MEQNEQACDELKAFQEFFINVIDENRDKTDLLETLRKRLPELEMKKAECVKLDEEFKTELGNAKDINAEMTKMNMAWNQEEPILNEELGKLQATYNITTKVNDYFTAKNDRLISEIEQLESEKKNIEQMLLTKDIKDLTLQSKLNHLSQNFNDIVTQMDVADQDAKKVKQICGETQMKMKELEMELEETVNDYNAVRNDVDKIRDEIESMEKCDDVNNASEQYKMDVSTLHDFDNNEEDEADLLNKLMELRKENAKALQEIFDLEKTMTI
ncbi:hypothetical protein M8J77_012966 [Diaphorina citri]|nr:hypothetical protein M8J77_012966 [Diaphorina citri]